MIKSIKQTNHGAHCDEFLTHEEEADGFSTVYHDNTPWHETNVLLKM